MAKAYFIGLGGCGLKTVSELYKKLHPQDPSGVDYLFTYIDTDSATYDEINHDSIVIRSRDFVNLGNTNPQQLYQSAVNSNDPQSARIKEWAVEQGVKGHLTFPNQVLADGAQAVRMFGRFGIVKEYSNIMSELKQKLAPFQNLRDNDGEVVDPNIWVFASSCGGTGSSLTLDILYIINRIIVDELSLHDPQLKLVLFMPEPFIALNPNNEQYKLNAYAYMWELNAFRLAFRSGRNDLYGEFAAIPRRTGWTNKPFQMFKYIIPVDTESDHRHKIDVKELYPTVAEMVYFLNMGNVKNSTISNMSNDNRLVNSELIQHNDTRCLWTTPLIAYGYRAIKKANQELKKYLHTRAMYELTRYGLLGEDMQEEEREQAKQNFAKKYILPYLTNLEGICQANSQSLQSRICNLFDEIYPLKPEGLLDSKLDFVLNEVATKYDTTEFESISRQVLEDIKQAISNGLSEEIRMHGLIYTKTLLNLVDDHYLEKVIIDKLEALIKTLQNQRDDARLKCESYRGSLKKRNNAIACAASFEDYRNAEALYQTIKKSIDIVQSLTSYPMGFLEELRRGTNDKVGLQKLIEKANASCAQYANAYEELAKEFCASESNAFTTYLPNLKAIAIGENSDWPAGTLFDQLYSNSILDYDRQEANRIGGKRIPVRKSEDSGNRCLSYYLQEIDKDNMLFVTLAQIDNFKQADLFEKRVIEPLEQSVQKAIENKGSQASKWLDISLEQALQQSDFLPAGLTLEKFIEQLGNKDSIHVLYPMRSGASAAAYRYYYAGASQTLAAKLGYQKSDGVQFILDSQMEDRFLIMKMPIGLDFYSYAYFQAIEQEYNKNFPKIKEQADPAGCHTHKIFALADLNLDRALMAVTLPRKANSLIQFTKALFFQNTLKVMKKSAKETYNDLFGILTMPSFDIQDQSASATDPNDSFMAMFEEADATSSSGVFEESSLDVADDNFLELDINEVTGSWQIDFHVKNVEIKADGTLKIDDDLSAKRYVLDKQYLLTTSAFADGLMNMENGELQRMLSKQAEAYDQLMDNQSFLQAVRNLFAEIKRTMLEFGTPQNRKFAMFMNAWQKKPANNDYLRIIMSTINNMLK